MEWLSRQLTTSELLFPTNFLDNFGRSRSRGPPDTSAPTPAPAATPAPVIHSQTVKKSTDRPTTADRASALSKVEKALAEMMNRVHQLMETVFELDATMRQLVRRRHSQRGCRGANVTQSRKFAQFVGLTSIKSSFKRKNSNKFFGRGLTACLCLILLLHQTSNNTTFLSGSPRRKSWLRLRREAIIRLLALLVFVCLLASLILCSSEIQCHCLSSLVSAPDMSSRSKCHLDAAVRLSKAFSVYLSGLLVLRGRHDDDDDCAGH